MKKISEDYFYKNVEFLRPLKQLQVNGINDILDHYTQTQDRYPNMGLDGLASYLGQCRTESDNKFQPIREYGKLNYFKYLIGKLGIDSLKEAYMFRGWGRMQTTGETNFYRAVGIINEFVGYKKFNSPHELGEYLLSPHELAEESHYDMIVSFECFNKGLYTGRRIAEFRIGADFDFYNARKVVNPGQIRLAKKYPRGKHAQMLNQIVSDSKKFHKALIYE